MLSYRLIEKEIQRVINLRNITLESRVEDDLCKSKQNVIKFKSLGKQTFTSLESNEEKEQDQVWDIEYVK